MSTRVGLKCPSCSGTQEAGSSHKRRRIALAAALALTAVAATMLFAGDDDRSPPDVDDIAAGSVERTVQVTGAGGVAVTGTLRLPEGIGRARVPGVLIIPGFGPTDRNGRVTPGGQRDDLYRDVSEELAHDGMASFRYDKRGTGQSALAPGQELALDDMAADARAGIDLLAERREIDGEALAVVGHDEGALLAMRVAASDPRVKALVLVSAPGRPLVDVIADDFAATHTEATAQSVRQTVAALTTTGTLPAPETLPAELRGFFPREHVPYLRQVFSADPLADAREVEVPALVVHGGRATFATATDAERLVEALGGETEVLVAPEAGPTLAKALPPGAPGGRHGGAGAGDHGGVATRLERDRVALDRISSWLAARVTSNRRR